MRVRASGMRRFCRWICEVLRDDRSRGESVRLIFGLDLGQSTDHSALAGVDRQRLPAPIFRRKFRYVIRYLDEFPLGMSYPDQVRRVWAPANEASPAAGTFSSPRVKGSRVGVDYTGVGRPVYDILKEARPPVLLYPMLTTGGHSITFDKDTREYHVPKVEQVSLLQLLLQADLLAWHESLPHAGKLADQLAKYRVKITKSKNEQFGAMSGANDDLVSAVMTACWLGEQVGDSEPGKIGVGEPSRAGGVGNVERGPKADRAEQGLMFAQYSM